MKRIEQKSSIANKREPDVVLVPLSCFTEARCLPLLDSICRLLRSKLRIEAEFKCVWETLPSPVKDKNGKDIHKETDLQSLQVINENLAVLLEKKLIGVWCVHNEHEPSVRASVMYEIKHLCHVGLKMCSNTCHSWLPGLVVREGSQGWMTVEYYRVVCQHGSRVLDTSGTAG